MRVLVVIGDPARLRATAGRLRIDGHAVDEVRTLARARAAALDADYDALVVAHRLADGTGAAFVAERRAAGWDRSVLVLAGDGGPGVRLAALAAGADDVLPGEHPSLDELALRVRKVLRRAPGTSGPDDDAIRCGPLTVVRSRQEVLLDGRPLALSATQYCLAEALVEAQGRPVPAAALLDRCWDRNRVGGNPLPAQLTRLRKALGSRVSVSWVRGEGHALRSRRP